MRLGNNVSEQDTQKIRCLSLWLQGTHEVPRLKYPFKLINIFLYKIKKEKKKKDLLIYYERKKNPRRE